MLTQRRVVLVVTGGVAAYKSAYLARRLIESGAELRVVMSESAFNFVGPQTFAAITGAQPYSDLFGDDDVSPHTDLARWADLVVVAPATAATLARVAHGLSDNLVSALLLATEDPILFAPAMHSEMWLNPATARNVETLRADGHLFVGPNTGDLAGGDVGIGRVAEPDEILDRIESILGEVANGRSILITAGGTREPVDPVRYIGNRSSGKMGHAIADEAARRGYQVTLVTSSSLATHPAVKVVSVETAEEMQEAVDGIEADVAIMSAAVADFKPAEPNESKLARSEGLESIKLTPTPDILASVVERDPRPVVIGFAAETGGIERAVEKARKKGVDLMVYNDVTEPGSGFGTDTNNVALIDSEGEIYDLPMMAKTDVAKRLMDAIEALVSTRG